MADQHIAAYLNDHLAGSVTALELLEQRAEDQRQRVEAFRLEAAREALGGTS
jgi:hypothetical protein